jgi:hypothetical protein
MTVSFEGLTLTVDSVEKSLEFYCGKLGLSAGPTRSSAGILAGERLRTVGQHLASVDAVASSLHR